MWLIDAVLRSVCGGVVSCRVRAGCESHPKWFRYLGENGNLRRSE